MRQNVRIVIRDSRIISFFAVLGYLFLAEILNLYQVIGGAIILTGSYLISKLHIKQANLKVSWGDREMGDWGVGGIKKNY